LLGLLLTVLCPRVVVNAIDFPGVSSFSKK